MLSYAYFLLKGGVFHAPRRNAGDRDRAAALAPSSAAGRWEPHRNALQTAGLLAAWATLYPNPDYYQWAIVEKATGQVFGSISIFNAALGAQEKKAAWPELDTSGGVWETGYCIGQKWWNQGFTTEALKAVVDYWFRNTDSNWLCCCYAKENPASGRVMQKAGFAYHHDGIDHKFDGTPVECRYCLLTR